MPKELFQNRLYYTSYFDVFFIVFTCCCCLVKFVGGWLIQETEAESGAGSAAGCTAAASASETRKVYNTYPSSREARA